MEILDTMYSVRCVDSKRYSVQTFPTNYATEAYGVVGLTRSPKNSVEDRLEADAALFQGVLQFFLFNQVGRRQIQMCRQHSAIKITKQNTSKSALDQVATSRLLPT